MPLVGVVIPAFNAERTIDRTLASVRAQTHAMLDIVVVDDGSTDGTADRVRRHAAQDERVRLVQQDNGGVATARNRGIRESRSDLLAPVDSDDLWHPTKIARQLAVLDSSPDIGLVATAYSVIDERDLLIAEIAGKLPPRTQFEDLCRRNFMGNGSSALMRRELIERFGGYDPSLRRRGGEGCEDLQLYLRIAEVSELAVIREPLTAYRRSPTNMSGAAAQMIRSFDLVAADFCARRPELLPRFREHRMYMLLWLLNGSVRSGKFSQAKDVAAELVATQSGTLPSAFLEAAFRVMRGAKRHWLDERGRRPPLNWL